jgi:hypothetical protein
VLLLAVLHVSLVRSVFFFTGKKQKVNESESYTIFLENMEFPKSKKVPPGTGKHLSSYRNVSRIYTTDQRCKIGLPLSMALVQFAPYVYDQWGVSKPKFAIVNG